MTCIIDKTIRFVKFQLTRSRGAWPLEYSDSRGQTGNFNSHAHVERDLICLKSQKIIIHISTHTLTWSVTRFVNTAEVYLQFQLTRSRGAWRNGKCCKYWFYISTHTLTWSVTVQIRQFLGQQTFQLTRSRGAWPQKNSPKAVIKIISTHTLTWSVTTAVLQLVRITKISTHTLTWSVTCIIDKTIRFVKFQLTRSRGAWPLK